MVTDHVSLLWPLLEYKDGPSYPQLFSMISLLSQLHTAMLMPFQGYHKN